MKHAIAAAAQAFIQCGRRKRLYEWIGAVHINEAADEENDEKF